VFSDFEEKTCIGIFKFQRKNFFNNFQISSLWGFANFKSNYVSSCIWWACVL